MVSTKRCCRSLLTAFNVVFILSGFTAIGGGIWMIFDPGLFDIFFGIYKFIYPAAILITTGVLIVLVSFCGFVGVMKERKCALKGYSIMLLMISSAEIIAGGLGFAFHTTIKAEIKKQTQIIVNTKYGSGSIGVDHAVNQLQERLKCCGAVSWKDYYESQWIRSLHAEKKYVPESCCTHPQRCTVRSELRLIYKEGCTEKLAKLTKKNLIILGGIGLGLSCIQVFGIFFSTYVYASVTPSFSPSEMEFA